jgi:hypothetical protein
MADSSFTTLVANTLEEVRMIAGDEQTFVYNIYGDGWNPISLENATCSVVIFKYGDPSYIFANLSGSITLSGSVTNQFTATFSGSGLSGLYQQQVRIVDGHGGVHIPCQGKIVIFPSSENS